MCKVKWAFSFRGSLSVPTQHKSKVENCQQCSFNIYSHNSDHIVSQTPATEGKKRGQSEWIHVFFFVIKIYHSIVSPETKPIHKYSHHYKQFHQLFASVVMSSGHRAFCIHFHFQSLAWTLALVTELYSRKQRQFFLSF